MSQAKSKQVDKTTKTQAPVQKASKQRVEKPKGPKPDFTPRAKAAEGQVSSRPTTKVEAELQKGFLRRLDKMSTEVSLDFFIDLRAKCRANPDRSAAEAAYKAGVEAKSKEIRVQAFDQTVLEAARQLRTEDINMILPSLRRAGLRYQGGHVQVRQETTWVEPAVFNDLAFVLVPKAVPKVAVVQAPAPAQEQQAA